MPKGSNLRNGKKNEGSNLANFSTPKTVHILLMSYF